MKYFDNSYAYRILKDVIQIHICENNKKVFVSKNCPFSNHVSKSSNVFRYSYKLNIGKCYCCGKAFNSEKRLLKLLKYKDKLEDRHRRFEIYYDDLPF